MPSDLQSGRNFQIIMQLLSDTIDRVPTAFPRLNINLVLLLLLTTLVLFSILPSTQAQLPLYDLPNSYENPVYTSSSIARTRAGRFVVANMLTDSVSIIGLAHDIEAEISVEADPRGVAITPDNALALVTSRGSGMLSLIGLENNNLLATYLIGEQPYHVVATENTAYVSLQGTSEIVVVRLEDGAILQRIPTPPNPTALALWGDFLYVTHFWTGELSLIYLPAGEVVQTIRPNPQSSLSQSIEIDPINGRAFLPQSLSNDTLLQTSLDNRIVPVVQVVDLKTLLVEEQINLVVADRNLSMPFAVKQPTNRSRLYIAHAGTNNVTVLNLNSGVAEAHFEVGANPRGILFNANYTQVITHDALDNSLTITDTRFFGLEDNLPTTSGLVQADTLIGAKLFHNATDNRMSANDLINCASCHFDGQTDRRVWNESPTPQLDDLSAIAPDFIKAHLQLMQGGAGLGEDSFDMAALLSYLQTGREQP